MGQDVGSDKLQRCPTTLLPPRALCVLPTLRETHLRPFCKKPTKTPNLGALRKTGSQSPPQSPPLSKNILPFPQLLALHTLTHVHKCPYVTSLKNTFLTLREKLNFISLSHKPLQQNKKISLVKRPVHLLKCTIVHLSTQGFGPSRVGFAHQDNWVPPILAQPK
jgi:hypothetical protein